MPIYHVAKKMESLYYGGQSIGRVYHGSTLVFDKAAGGGGGGTDPNFANVVFLSGFEGADGATIFTDESVHARALTTLGNTQVDTAQFKFGSASALFNGSGDGISATDDPDWTFGADAFTVEAWVRPTVTGTKWIVGQYSSSTSARGWMLFYELNQVRWIAWDAGGVARALFQGSSSWSLEQWHHVAVDRTPEGVLRIYLNGAMVAKDAAYTHTLRNVASPLSIGHGNGASAANTMNGHLDEVRVTKGVARYASDGGFAVPTAAFPRS